MKKVYVLICVLMVLMAGRSLADVVYLKDGTSVRGQIISETKYSVKITADGLPRVFYSDQIDHVEHIDPEQEAAMVQAEAGVIPDSTRELILQLLEANQALAGIQQSMRSFLNALSPEKQAELADHLTMDSLIEHFVPIYAKYFTEEDFSVMIQYFNSPTGKRAVEAAPKIMQESIQVAAEYFKNIEKSILKR